MHCPFPATENGPKTTAEKQSSERAVCHLSSVLRVAKGGCEMLLIPRNNDATFTSPDKAYDLGTAWHRQAGTKPLRSCSMERPQTFQVGCKNGQAATWPAAAARSKIRQVHWRSFVREIVKHDVQTRIYICPFLSDSFRGSMSTSTGWMGSPLAVGQSKHEAIGCTRVTTQL